MKNPLENKADYVDTREVIEYKEFLEEELLDYYNQWVEDHNDHCETGQELEEAQTLEDAEYIDEEAFTDTCKETIEELENINFLIEQLDGYGDFEHGETLIPREDFVEYSKDMLEDCGDIPKNLPFYIENNIDWEGVAHDLEVDYMTADYKGQEYLMRA